MLDELAEIPVCIGYEIDGKITDEIPADVQGLEQIKPRSTPRSKAGAAPPRASASSTSCPRQRKEYLRFQERESGAKIGMVSTGPDRDQTMVLPEFAAALDELHG